MCWDCIKLYALTASAQFLTKQDMCDLASHAAGLPLEAASAIAMYRGILSLCLTCMPPAHTLHMKTALVDDCCVPGIGTRETVYMLSETGALGEPTEKFYKAYHVNWLLTTKIALCTASSQTCQSMP